MKIPKFHFYPDNYEGGTDDFTLEEDGAYLRILILQFREWDFTKERAQAKLKQRGIKARNFEKLWAKIEPKLTTDGNVFWSERLRFEMLKADATSCKRKESADIRWGNAYANAHPNADTKAQDLHMPVLNTPTYTSTSSDLGESAERGNFDPDFSSLPVSCETTADRELMYNAIGRTLYDLEELSVDISNPKIRALMPWWHHLKTTGRHPNRNSIKELIKRTDSAEVAWISNAVSHSISNDYAGVVPFKKPEQDIPSDHPDAKARPNQILTNGQKALAKAILDNKVEIQ